MALGTRLGTQLGTELGSALDGDYLAALRAQVVSAWDTTVQVGGVNQRTSLFEGDYYGVDGVTSKVGTIIDRIDPTHALAQTVSARQVAVPTVDATLGNALTLPFAGAQWYGSNRPASAWRHQHSGIGFWCAVWTATNASSRAMWSTINIAALPANNGSYFVASATGVTFRAYNAGALAVNASGTAVAYPAGSACTVAISVLDGAAQELQVRSDGAQVASAATSSFSVADPAAALLFGSHLDSTLPFLGRLGLLMFAPFRPSADQLAILNAYTVAKYGVAV
jgi:hypothetical protein